MSTTSWMPDRQPVVQRYLQDHPDVARQVAAWRAQRDALRAAFAPVAAEPIPPRLGLERLVQQRLSRRLVPWRAAAAVLLAFGLGGAGGWFLHGGLQPTAGTSRCWRSRRWPTMWSIPPTCGARPNSAPQQRDDLARWVSNRLQPSGGAARPVGRRLQLHRRPARRDTGRAGRPVHVRRPARRAAHGVRAAAARRRSLPIQHIDFAHVDGCAWIDKGVGYTVVGKLPPTELRRLAEFVRGQYGGAG